MIEICLGCLLLVLCYILCRTRKNYWESKGVPYLKPFFFFGNFFNVVIGKESFFERLRWLYFQHETPYIGIYLFYKADLLIKSPDLIRTILVKDFSKFSDRNIISKESVDPVAYHAIFSVKYDVWRHLRAKISPVFSPGKIKLMFPLMEKCAQDMKNYLVKNNGKNLEVEILAKRLVTDIVSSCAFGINTHALEDEKSEIFKMATQLMDLKSFVRNISVFACLFMPNLAYIFRFTIFDRTASNYFIEVFKETMKERENKKIIRDDLIDLLNAMKKNEDSNEDYKFDDIKMAAQAITFFSAGKDPTAISISFTLYELAMNQGIQKRLRQEIRQSFEKTGSFTYEIIHEMKYLDMVCCESLRKYPPIVFLRRQALDDYTFEETGLKLDRNGCILISISGLHYDPNYFPQPEIFNPERFRDKTNIEPYTYMPFGEGPRNCIGQRFGLQFMKITLATIIKDFKVEPTDLIDVPLRFDSRTIVPKSKHGIYLKIVQLN